MTAREALVRLGANPDEVAAMTMTHVLEEIRRRTPVPDVGTVRKRQHLSVVRPS